MWNLINRPLIADITYRSQLPIEGQNGGEGMIWNETKECMSADEKLTLQSARLVKQVDRVYHNVEYYRKRMQSVGLEPGDIKDIEDLKKLP